MTSKKMFELLGGIDPAYVAEADITDRIPAKKSEGKSKDKDGERAFGRFMSSPVAAAVLSGIVAFGVLFFIVRAGQNAPVVPPDPPAGSSASETQLPETEPSERKTERTTQSTDTETETDAHADRRNAPAAPVWQTLITVFVMAGGAALIVFAVSAKRRRANTQAERIPGARLLTAAAVTYLASARLVITPIVGCIILNNQMKGPVEQASKYSAFLMSDVRTTLSAAIPVCIAFIAGLLLICTAAVLSWYRRLSVRRGVIFTGISLVCLALMSRIQWALSSSDALSNIAWRAQMPSMFHVYSPFSILGIVLLLFVVLGLMMAALIVMVRRLTSPVRMQLPTAGGNKRSFLTLVIVLYALSRIMVYWNAAVSLVASLKHIRELDILLISTVYSILNGLFCDTIFLLYVTVWHRRNRTPAFWPAAFAYFAVTKLRSALVCIPDIVHALTADLISAGLPGGVISPAISAVFCAAGFAFAVVSVRQALTGWQRKWGAAAYASCLFLSPVVSLILMPMLRDHYKVDVVGSGLMLLITALFWAAILLFIFKNKYPVLIEHSLHEHSPRAKREQSDT